MTPDLPGSKIKIQCDLQQELKREDLMLEATVEYQGKQIAKACVAANKPSVKLEMALYNTQEYEWGVHTWSPENPCLYDLELRLVSAGQTVDTVGSYFGMREIRIDGKNILLNGSPLYQRADSRSGILASKPFDPSQRSGFNRGY